MTQQKKGFTIIEVVLVLAIAGLIFLMVFIALPALQRGQRDSQRRDDMSRFSSQLTSFSTNNRGKIPTDNPAIQSFKNSYLKSASDEFNDPKTGSPYTITFQNGAANGAVAPGDGVIFYHYQAKCSDENAVAAGQREAAIRVQLESGGVYCQSSK